MPVPRIAIFTISFYGLGRFRQESTVVAQKQGCTSLSLVLNTSALVRRAVSSVVEHYLDTVGVTGSNPVSRIPSQRPLGAIYLT